MALNETYQDNSEQFGNYVRAMLSNIEPDAAAADDAYVLFKKELEKKRRRRIIFWFFLLLATLLLLLTGILFFSNRNLQLHTTPDAKKDAGNNKQVPATEIKANQSTHTIEEKQNKSDDSVVLKDASGNQTTKGSDSNKTNTVPSSNVDSLVAPDKIIKIAEPDAKPYQNSPDSLLKMGISKADNSKKTKIDSIKKAKTDTVYIIW